MTLEYLDSYSISGASVAGLIYQYIMSNHSLFPVRNLLFILLFTVISISAFSQTPEKRELNYDKSKIESRQFDSGNIDRYKSDDTFDYTEKKREPTWVERSWNWLKRIGEKILSYMFDDIEPVVGAIRWVLKILPYIVGAITLYLLIKLFLNISGQSILEGKTAIPEIEISEDEKLLQERNLPELINKAIGNADFRLAIRYYYLLVLKNLMEKKLIAWQQEKTNEDYVNEIAAGNIKAEFATITNLYDYVWYGNFSVSQSEFSKFELQLKKFIKSI